jgi:NAD(P)H-dependent flavin oxidoreductase YrpB (nitropropane dioxygenase family)
MLPEEVGEISMPMNRVCEMTGAEFPLFAFSHCRDVVAAVSKDGGFGVFGATRFSPEQLEEELAWIDAHVDGAPYGVDVLVPEVIDPRVRELADNKSRAAAIDPSYQGFVNDILGQYGIAPEAEMPILQERMGITPENGLALMEVAFRHPIKLIANALGVAPPAMIEEGKKRGVPVAALVGAKEHAIRQAEADVDIIVAQGTEAGGHCGEVSTLVLIPEVTRALRRAGYDIPVLAAGGIMTGGQMAGMMAAGAQGAWTGSVWLATPEAETSETFREKMVAARSRDTVRSRSRTGKPARQLKTPWHEAWDAQDGPGTLPMPLMGMVSEPAFARIEREAAAGNASAQELVTYFVGQGVGLVEQVRSSKQVVQDFREEFLEAVGGLAASIGME